MSHSFLPVLALALLGGGKADGPEIDRPQATYGYLGAPRPKTGGILPGDAAYFSFDIKSLTFDKDGRCRYSVGIVVTGADGQTIFEQKPHNAVGYNFFGGGVVRSAVRIEAPLNLKPGPVHWRVRVTDRASGKATEIEGDSKILPPAFGLARVGTFADAEQHVPTPPIAVVGTQLYLGFGVVGFGRGKEKQPDLEVSLTIRDEKGKTTMPHPLTGQINKDVGPDVGYVPLQFMLSLDRVGRYTVELAAHDRVSGATSTVQLPVRILAAE